MALSELEILSDIADILAEDANVPVGSVRLSSRLDGDLGLDASMKANVIGTVRTRFQVGVSDEEASKFATVGDIAAYLQAAIG